MVRSRSGGDLYLKFFNLWSHFVAFIQGNLKNFWSDFGDISIFTTWSFTYISIPTPGLLAIGPDHLSFQGGQTEHF